MVIADGNLKYAVLNAIVGDWTEVNKKCIYHFGFKDNNPETPILSINYATPVDYKLFFENEICVIEINKVKYRLWYRDSADDVRMELHSHKLKIRLEKIM